jgi:hypothetical protein
MSLHPFSPPTRKYLLMPSRFSILALAVLLIMSSGARKAFASSISFTGNLRTDATVLACGTGCTLGPMNSDGDYAQYAAVVRSFTLTSASSVEIVSFSYGGGTNGNGTVIIQGGLEPYLSLFDAAGDFLSSTYLGVTCPAGAHTNTSSGECYDVLLNAGNLAAGTYQVALSAYANMSFAENLGTGTLTDGFTGLGNLAFGEDLHYAFDVDINTPTTPVPEPSTGVLVALASFGLNVLRRKFSKENYDEN